MKCITLFSFFFSSIFSFGQSGLALDSLMTIAAHYRNNRQWVVADSVFREALKIAEARGDKESQSKIYNNLNYTLFKMSRYKEAIKASEKELEINLQIGNDTIIADSYYNLGLNYKKIGSFNATSDNLLKAIEIYEKIEWNLGIARTWKVLGSLHRQHGNYHKALGYHFLALAAYQKMDSIAYIPGCYHNLGRVYTDSGLFDVGMKFLFKARALNKVYGFSTSMNNSQIGRSYLEVGRLDSAENYLIKAMIQRRAEGNRSKIETSHILLTRLYTSKEDYFLANKHADTAYTMASDMEISDDLIEIIELQIDLGKRKNYFRFLVGKYEELFELKQRVSWDNELKGNAKFEAEYDVLKKNQMIVLKDAQLVFQTLENEKLSLRNRAFLIGFFIAIFFVGIIIFFYFKLRRSKKETEKKNGLLIESNVLIDSLHKELSHRTKNYYSMFGGILKYDRKRCDNEETKILLNNYINRVEAMSQIQRYLLEENSVSHDVQLDLYLSDLLANIDLVLNKETPKVIIIEHFETISCDYDKALRLGLVMNEMVSNSFEHGFKDLEKPKLNVKLTTEGDRVIFLEISDNGNGFKKPDSSSKETSSGIGLMEMILKSVNGDLKYLGNRKLGVSVKVKVPK